MLQHDAPVDPKERKELEKKKKTLQDIIKKLAEEQPDQALHAKKVRQCVISCAVETRTGHDSEHAVRDYNVFSAMV